MGALSLVATAALAGDNAQIEPIGFSENGKFFAFEQYGEQDGTGAGYSEIFFVDVAKNSWTNKPVRIRATEDTMAYQDLEFCRDKARRGATRILLNNDIQPGTTGIAHLADYNANFGYSFPGRTDFKFDAAGGSHTLTVSGTDVQGVVDWYGQNVQLMTLKLRLYNGESAIDNSDPFSSSVVLQQDTKLPESRKYARNYSINGVYEYKKSLVVIVGYDVAGFEGPDKRYIAVTWSAK